MTLAISSDPRNARHLSSALFTSLNTIDRMLARDTQPRVLKVRKRTVAKVDLIGWVVRRCIQCEDLTLCRFNVYQEFSSVRGLMKAIAVNDRSWPRLCGNSFYAHVLGVADF
jgi:hypothetical protein